MILPTPLTVVFLAAAFRFEDDIIAAVLLLAAVMLEYALSLRGSE